MEDVSYKTGSFTDWLGREHKFIVCGILRNPVRETKLSTIDEGLDVECFVPVMDTPGYDDGHVKKFLFLGVSVCNPLDVFNEDIGKKIAYNKATSKKLAWKWLGTDVPRLLGPKVVDAILEQEVDFISNNPESVIAGYGESELKYKVKMIAQDIYKQLPPTEQDALKAVVKSENIGALLALADAMEGELPALPKPATVKKISLSKKSGTRTEANG